jgi:DNA-binding LacI/PurR family transcriptional regulator
MTALGVMRKSYEDSIAIPRDLSVVGFDDIRIAKYILPPLTTVQMSQAELARIAFEALLNEVNRDNPLPEGSNYELKTSLVVRESTAAARKS